MYNIEITFNNGATHKLSIDRVKLSVIDDYFNAESGVEEIKVLEALNEGLIDPSRHQNYCYLYDEALRIDKARYN